MTSQRAKLLKSFVLSQIFLYALLIVAATKASVSLEYSLMKIKPDGIHSGKNSLQLNAARNEYESFQVVCNGPMQQVDVAVNTSAPLSPFQVYREGYITVTTPSNNEGGTGRYPDPLIPKIDLFKSEVRNGFPFDVPAGENRIIWVDFFVPEPCEAGDYSLQLVVTENGVQAAVLPVTIHVWNFTLPSFPSIPTNFGYDGWEVLRAHYGEAGMDSHYDQIVPLAHMYLDAALMNRITLGSCMREEWDLFADPIDWNMIFERWGSFFSGRHVPFGLESTRITCLELPDIADDDAERVAFWHEFAQQFRNRGWFYLLLDYTYDEPGELEDYQEIIHRAGLVHQADPELRVLVTTDIQEAQNFGVLDVIDIWVPIINNIYGKPYEICWGEEYVGDHRADYNSLLATGAELWWYQSCMSHGCEGSDPNDTCESEYPSYMIDYSGVRNRVMSWMSYYYDIHGELYFATNYTDEEGDAWQSQYYFGGNGDGTLFYPGRPDVIGGSSNIPIESIRLKYIRDGIEDYEYFLLHEQLFGRANTISLMNAIITNAYTYQDDAQIMQQIRTQIGEAISGSQSNTGVDLSMPNTYFSPGDQCRLDAQVYSYNAPLDNTPLCIVLDVYGEYFFWDSWLHDLDYNRVSIPAGEQTVTVIPAFEWPDTGSDELHGLIFWGALVNEAFTAVIGNFDYFEFGYGPR